MGNSRACALKRSEPGCPPAALLGYRKHSDLGLEPICTVASESQTYPLGFLSLRVKSRLLTGISREEAGYSCAGFAPRNALMPPRRLLPSRRRTLEANVGRVGRRGLGRMVAARINSISRASASSRLRS
jgi:hypothetical protein